jgi:hypothetical protein
MLFSKGSSGLNHIIIMMGTASSRKTRVRRQAGQSFFFAFSHDILLALLVKLIWY